MSTNSKSHSLAAMARVRAEWRRALAPAGLPATMAPANAIRPIAVGILK